MKNITAVFSFRIIIILFVLSSGLGSSCAKPPLKELVLYYSFKNTKQAGVTDQSGYDNDGKIAAVVTSNTPSLVSMQQTRQLTIAVWIKPNSIPQEFPVIVGKGGNWAPGAYGGYELTLNANGDNDLVFVSGSSAVATGGANGRWINNHLGEWIHVVFALNDETKTAKFYVNGKPTNDEVDFGSYFNNSIPLNFDVPNNLYVGKPDPAHHPNRASFDGSMRELMIFNRALTAEEVQALFKSSKPSVANKS